MGQLLSGVQLQTKRDAKPVSEGLDNCPARVVAPMSVNLGKSSRMELADGPFPMMISIA